MVDERGWPLPPRPWQYSYRTQRCSCIALTELGRGGERTASSASSQRAARHEGAKSEHSRQSDQGDEEQREACREEPAPQLAKAVSPHGYACCSRASRRDIRARCPRAVIPKVLQSPIPNERWAQFPRAKGRCR